MFDYRPLETLPRVAAQVSVLVAAENEERTRGRSLAEVEAAVRAAGRPALRVTSFPNEGHNLPRYRPDDLTRAILSVATGATA
jgi:hypothetical protein